MLTSAHYQLQSESVFLDGIYLLQKRIADEKSILSADDQAEEQNRGLTANGALFSDGW